MAKPISNEKRADIMKHMQMGESKENIAKWLFISTRTVSRVLNKFKTTGSYEPEPQNSGRKQILTNEIMDKVIDKIKEEPDMTLIELIDEFKFPVTESALCKRLIKLGLTYEKRHFFQIGKKEKML